MSFNGIPIMVLSFLNPHQHVVIFYISMEKDKDVYIHTVWKVSVFGVLLVRIFPILNWIRRDPEYLSVFSPNVGKYRPEKLQIRTLFTYWLVYQSDRYSYVFGNAKLILCFWLYFVLREKYPNMEFFLVRIFPFSIQIRENTEQ